MSATGRERVTQMAAKTVFVRGTPLPHVAGRIDYISNPDRQENLLAFYDNSDPGFWSALAAYERQQGKLNPTKKVCEAREFIYGIPNELQERYSMKKLAEGLATNFSRRYGVKCCCAIHLNEEENNLHAHLIFPERKILEQEKISIATRNTYFDEDGKRASKKVCVDENGELKPGCRLVLKGENLSNVSFSSKNLEFRKRGFMFQEKQRMAAFWNKYCIETEWEVYNPKTNPHFAMTRLCKGEPPEIRAEKEQINALKKEYNELVDRLIDNGIVLPEEATSIKKAVERDANKESDQIVLTDNEALNYLKKLKILIKEKVDSFRERLRTLQRQLQKEDKKPSLDDLIKAASDKNQPQNPSRPRPRRHSEWER